MNTKAAFFVLALGLAAISCSTPRLELAEPTGYSVQNNVQMATITPTAEPTSTHTLTPIPPTKTATPTKTPRPTSTPAPVGAIAKVTGKDGVNVRIGPCNQPIMTTAPLGTILPVTGWYQSPNGYIWWRTELTGKSGRVYEGWVYGELVDVSNATDIPLVVITQCPSFIDTPPTPAQASSPTTVVSPAVRPACQRRTDAIVGFEGITVYVEPRLLRGDREFNGNGPNVTVKVLLAHNDHVVGKKVSMRAEETAGDGTFAEDDTGWSPLYRAPSGWRIENIDVPLSQVDPATGNPYGEWSWSYTDNNIELDIYEPNDGGPVSRYVVKGDTKGDDVWNNGYQHLEDTHAVVSFRIIKVDLIQEGNCQ